MIEQVTFWHVGYERVCRGETTGNWHTTFTNGEGVKVVEVRWKDHLGTTFRTYVRETNILEKEMVTL